MMRCPNCRKLATAKHLRESPECDEIVAKLCGMRAVSKRVNPGRAGGRKSKLSPCPKCGQSFGVAEMRKHKCEVKP